MWGEYDTWEENAEHLTNVADHFFQREVAIWLAHSMMTYWPYKA
jgi:hypothetical protein